MRRANGKGSISYYKKKKLFQVRISVIENGILKRKSLGYYKGRREAKKVLEEYIISPYDIDNSTITFKDLYDIFYKTKKENISYSTKNNYRFNFNHCQSISHLLIKEIKTPHLQDLMNRLEISTGSKKQLKGFLSMLFDYAIQMEYIAINRSKYIKIEKHTPVREKSIFTDKEIKRLWEHQEIYFVKVILLMLYTGLRIGEVPNIKKENIDFVNKIIRNTGNKTEKSKHRIIPIHNDIFNIIQELYNISHTDYLVCIEASGKNKPIHKETIRRNFNEIMKSLGMEHIPHDTRRTLASILDKNKISETVIMDILGHTDFRTTKEHYIINDEKTITEAMNEIKIIN